MMVALLYISIWTIGVQHNTHTTKNQTNYTTIDVLLSDTQTLIVICLYRFQKNRRWPRYIIRSEKYHQEFAHLLLSPQQAYLCLFYHFMLIDYIIR